MSPQLLRRPARPHTGELPDRPIPYAQLTRAEHTRVLLTAIDNAVILETILRFDSVLSEYTSHPHQLPPTPPDGDAVAAVAYIARVLDVPERDVIDGAGLAERTFYDWKSRGRKPRLSSLGQLWKIVQITEDLVAELPDPARWIKAEPHRRELLRSGNIDGLAVDAVRTATPTTAIRTPVAYALGIEQLSPALSGRRRTGRRPPAQRAIRRRAGGDAAT